MIASKTARFATRIAAVVAVSAALSAAIVAAAPGASDASPLTITPKPRIVDQRALAALSSLPALSSTPGLAISRAYGEHDEDCARVGGQAALVCKR